MRLMLTALLLLLASCASPRAHSTDPAMAGKVDYACHTDADCAVKNVGNCCGAYPTCVNRESPTFPDRVKAECAKTGTMGVCGFPVVKGCACVEGRCSDQVEDGSVER
jgi:hypothetical protein